MARRDFTVNAIARRLATGELVDPLGGRDDLEQPRPAHDEPDELPRRPAAHRPRPALRLAARLRPRRGHAAPDARVGAAACGYVSGERIGGGLPRTGWASCRSSCSAPHPAKALRLARDTGVLVARAARSSARRSATTQQSALPARCRSTSTSSRSSRRRPTPSAPLEVRLAALLHDLGKPQADAGRRRPRRDRRSDRRPRVSRRLRYPTRLRRLRRQARAASTCSQLRRTSRRRSRAAVPARATASGSRSTCSRTRTPTCAGRTSRAERADCASRRFGDARRAGARRSRTGLPISRSTAPT